MGKTRHEIPCIREGRDHPAGRAIAFAGQTHAGQAWHTPCHVSAGMIDIATVDLRRWLITVLDRIASVIASRMMSVARSSTWRWSFLSCRRGSWRCASPTRRSTSSRRRRSTGCCWSWTAPTRASLRPSEPWLSRLRPVLREIVIPSTQSLARSLSATSSTIL